MKQFQATVLRLSGRAKLSMRPNRFLLEIQDLKYVQDNILNSVHEDCFIIIIVLGGKLMETPHD